MYCFMVCHAHYFIGRGVGLLLVYIVGLVDCKLGLEKGTWACCTIVAAGFRCR